MPNPKIDEYGSKYWYKNGELHREDGPAIKYANDDKHWYKNGEHHREDGPAIECADGTKFWYKNGKYHRDDGPAKEYVNGDKYWYKNGIKITEEEILRILSNPNSDLTPFKELIEENAKPKNR